MANLKSQEMSASVNLLTAELSEDEVAVLVASLSYVLDQCEDQTLYNLFGADRDEVVGLKEDLESLLNGLEETFIKLPETKPETLEEILADEERWDAQFAASPDKLSKLVEQAKEEIQKGQVTKIILTDS
jgi:anthranilate/para-aminobenzoate synthase component I